MNDEWITARSTGKDKLRWRPIRRQGADVDGWEEGVLREEQQRRDFVCWLRNRQRALWSLAIPYRDEQGEAKGESF